MMSRNIGIFATVIAVLLSIAACADGPTGQSEDRYPTPTIDIMGRNLVPPPPQRMVFSYSLIGTTWEFSYVGTEYLLSSTVDFLQDGRFHTRNIKYRNPEIIHPQFRNGSDATPNNDEWEQDGALVRMTHNDGSSTSKGTLQYDFMSGTASNISGGSWTWTAIRSR